MKPRKRPLPASFLQEWNCIPVTQWGLRPTFERFYNAGLNESSDVLRETREVLHDLYENAKHVMSPNQIERVQNVLGDEYLVGTEKPKFCAICTKPRNDLYPERLNSKMSWVCTDCCVLSAGDPRYSFDEAAPTPVRPLTLTAKGRSEE